MKADVLLVDDDEAVRTALAQTLELADLVSATADSVDAALRLIDRDWPGVVISDVRMPERDGFDLLGAVRTVDAELPVVLLTGQGDIPMAVRAMNEGAYDFLEKPCEPARLVEVARRALRTRGLVRENRALRRQLADGAPGARLLGDSPAMQRLRGRIERAAAAAIDVLITGETGAGKEVAARALHQLSPRAERPFVAVNCGALVRDLAGSELFGHEKGAFTGAVQRRIGRFEQAQGGTIFLDEIESMPMEHQVTLLRVLQEREVERIGGSAPVPLDVRVFAATKTDLMAAAAAGRFREDLVFRLDVARIEVPPLRERPEDVPLLFDHFVREAAAAAGVAPPPMPPGLAETLAARPWPGNVRELRNAARRFAAGLDFSEPTKATGGESLADRVAAYERRLIVEALNAHAGAVSPICEALGLPRKTFYDKLARHGLKPEDYR